MTHSAILAEDAQATERRMQESKAAGGCVLLIQDTTTLDYSDRPATEGLGTLENKSLRGMLAHTTLAVGADGMPLGVIKQLVWSRPPEEWGRRTKRHELAYAEKESYKWVAGLPEPPAEGIEPNQWVTVCDREAHIYPFLDLLQQRSIGYLVRAARGRSTVLGANIDGAQEGVASCAPLLDAVSGQPLLAEVEIALKRRPDREARSAQVEIRTATFTLKRPNNLPTVDKHAYRATLEVGVVEIREPQPPTGEQPVHWLLLTSLPVATQAEALHVAHCYTLRWMVERFHYILKSGCKLEASQLRSVDALERLLALYTRVAWRILQMTHQARLTPDVPCTVLLAPEEWQALWLFRNKSMDFPENPPSLQQVVHWIAMLGGFPGRKGDGNPGVKTIWLGWMTLMNYVDFFLAVRPALTKVVGNA